MVACLLICSLITLIFVCWEKKKKKMHINCVFILLKCICNMPCVLCICRCSLCSGGLCTMMYVDSIHNAARMKAHSEWFSITRIIHIYIYFNWLSTSTYIYSIFVVAIYTHVLSRYIAVEQPILLSTGMFWIILKCNCIDYIFVFVFALCSSSMHSSSARRKLHSDYLEPFFFSFWYAKNGSSNVCQ